jgi:hypothetical protein
VEFAKAQQQWLASIKIDEVKLAPSQRYALLALLYTHLTQPRPLPAGAIDDFLGGVAAFYRCAGGSPALKGQNHTVPDTPFARLLVEIWRVLPRSHRPATERQLISRTRRLIEHKVDWHRQEGRRVEWDSGAGHKLILQIVRPKGLTKAELQRFSLGGRWPAPRNDTRH